MIKKLVSIILITSLITAQIPCNGHCFSDEEVQSLRNSILTLENSDSLNSEIIKTLEKQIDSYIQYQNNDSLLISLYEQKLDLLDTRVELYKDLSKEIQPKWYENKYLWFGYGVISIILPTWVLSNVTE